MPETDQIQEQTPQTIDTGDAAGLSFDELVSALNDATQAEREGERSVNPQSAEGQTSQSGPDADHETSGADERAAETRPTFTVKDLAERLELSVEDLYAGLQLDQGLSLGEYKDRAKDLKRAEELLAKAQSSRLEIENELLRKRRELQVAQQSIGRELTEAERQTIAQQWDDYLQFQTRLAQEYIPDWRDDATRSAGEKLVNGVLDEYLFSEAERSITVDARLKKLVYDYARLRAEVESVASRRVVPKRKQGPRVTTETRSAVTRLSEQVKGGKVSQDQAVSELGRLLG